MPAPAQEEKRQSEKFSALAYMPHGAGPAMVGVYSAKIKVLGGNSIDVESYGVGPIKLMGVRKY